MSILHDKEEWMRNPWFQQHGREHADYTGFYVGISICTILRLTIIILNIVFCCCSPYKDYWRDPNTGNRYGLPLFIQPPHNNAPLTLQPELSKIEVPEVYVDEYPEEY